MKPGTCTGYESLLGMDRRRFLERFGMGLGSIALTDLVFTEIFITAMVVGSICV